MGSPPRFGCQMSVRYTRSVNGDYFEQKLKQPLSLSFCRMILAVGSLTALPRLRSNVMGLKGPSSSFAKRSKPLEDVECKSSIDQYDLHVSWVISAVYYKLPLPRCVQYPKAQRYAVCIPDDRWGFESWLPLVSLSRKSTHTTFSIIIGSVGSLHIRWILLLPASPPRSALLDPISSEICNGKCTSW